MGNEKKYKKSLIITSYILFLCSIIFPAVGIFCGKSPSVVIGGLFFGVLCVIAGFAARAEAKDRK